MRQLGNSRQVLVPRQAKTLQQYILKLAHDIPMSGHLGRTKTYQRVRSYYFWPTIYKDTKVYVYGCEACQKRKSTKPNKFSSPLLPSTPGQANHRVGIDLVGPLPRSSRKNNYILVMTDYFTKWAEAVPIKNKRKETVAHAIYKEWYCRHGIPYQLQSDQGKEFTNDLLERINKRMVVDHRVTTPYYPQANGQVERLNRVLVDSLSIYCSELSNVG